MEIKKVAHLSETDVETLVAAGKILREVSNGLEAKEIDELSTESLNLLQAVKDVLLTIIHD
jgi:hypothetical protein